MRESRPRTTAYRAHGNGCGNDRDDIKGGAWKLETLRLTRARDVRPGARRAPAGLDEYLLQWASCRCALSVYLVGNRYTTQRHMILAP